MKNLSRTAIDQFIRCPTCFYLQRKLGLRSPAMVPLTLAVATDALLKSEFDLVRKSKDNHPLWVREGLNVRAFDHPDLEIWRNNFRGIRVPFIETEYEIFGAVDDIWINQESGLLHIVDYKSTSKANDPNLDGEFGDGYKRQMEIYQWLFKAAGFNVSNVGYFLYVNGDKKNTFYDDKLVGSIKFHTTLIEYSGNSEWVSTAIRNAISCLHNPEIPKSKGNCDYCRYFSERLVIDRLVSPTNINGIE